MRAELQPRDEIEPEKKQLVREEYLLVVSRRMVWITLWCSLLLWEHSALQFFWKNPVSPYPGSVLASEC